MARICTALYSHHKKNQEFTTTLIKAAALRTAAFEEPDHTLVIK
jgi:hypothetical protein